MEARGVRRLSRFALAALVAVLALIVSGCASVEQQTPVKLGSTTPKATAGVDEVTWGLNAEPATLDPIYSYNFYDDQVIANTCESLYRLNPDLTRSLQLASYAKRTTPTTWVYGIRRGVHFWDGNELTAADVVYSLRRNLSPESYFNEYYAEVKDIRQTGKYQVTVQLSEPNALWNQVLVVTGSSILEKAWAEKQGKALGSPQGGLMCTGPYELTSWNRGSTITLTKNPHYWRAAGRPLSQKVVFHFLPDPSAQTEALLGGGIDGMFLIDPSGLPRLQSSDKSVYFGESLFLNFLIPTALKSPVSDVDVRKALSLVVDRPAIIKTIYHGAAQPMRTFGTPTVWGRDPKVREIFEPEWNSLSMYASPHVAEAKRLFRRAGSPGGKITLAFPTGGAEQQIAETVQSAAREIGINIALKGYTYAAIANLYYDKKAQASAGIDLIYAPFDVDTTSPLAMYHVFVPKVESVYNYSNYRNTEATDLIEEAERTYEPIRQAKLVGAAERMMMNDLPWIPLVSPDVVTALAPSLTGTPTTYAIYWSAWANQLGLRQ
ncbi:MAG: ABC transporter substrate-binding protein [Actinobacteria bacterium]|nr:ABC transporter substrate-binding protein [Actinomycetota bacterium]